MSTDAASEIIYYNAFFRHGVDENRRIQVPAKWRPSDPNIEFTIIRWPHGEMQDACLLVLPPGVWRTLVDKITVMPFNDPKAQSLRRLVGTKSAQANLDRAGRICLREEMARAVGIDHEAVLVGLIDRFQIWKPERYETVRLEDEQTSADAFKLLS